MKHPEILAPAGSMESLTAALRTGADAVYVGGKRFSARNNAANFSLDELKEAAEQCHSHGARLYLAVNTVIADGELQDFCDYIRSAAKAGVDAFIVQDLGAAQIIREAVPDAVLHASTQMSVHTAAGAGFLRSLGFERVVPARELSAETIEKICRQDIETEVFVHGALCMSVSGQCYMSAMIGSRSANRGCCGQACRLPFSAKGDKNRAALSLKDLSLLPSADKLCGIGVDSLKIEGRMKRPEYIAAAVSELKNALDGKSPDMGMLRGIFSRGGFTDGYFSGVHHDMFGVREREDVIAAKDIFPRLHELYRSERKVFAIDMKCTVKRGKPLTVTAVCGGISETVTGDIPDTAQKTPTDENALKKQLSKLGDTVFELKSFTADVDDGLFIPAGKLNELRRTLADRLTERVIAENTPKYTITDYVPKMSVQMSGETSVQMSGNAENLPIRAFCRTAEQAAAAAEQAEFVVVPHRLINADLLKSVPAEKIIISPERFITDEDDLTSRLRQLKSLGISRLLCHTLDTAAIGKELGFTLHGSFTMNMFNSFSAEYLRKLGFADCVASVEMTTEQLEKLRTELPVGAVIYGRIPLMLTVNCPIKNEVGCGKCTGQLIDRTNRRFPVACSKSYVEVLNSDVLYMGDRVDELKNISFGVVLLHDENGAETRAAVSLKRPNIGVTRGLYYRGVLENI